MISPASSAPRRAGRIFAVEHGIDDAVMLICMEPPEIEGNAAIVVQTLAVTGLAIVLIDAGASLDIGIRCASRPTQPRSPKSQTPSRKLTMSCRS